MSRRTHDHISEVLLGDLHPALSTLILDLEHIRSIAVDSVDLSLRSLDLNDLAILLALLTTSDLVDEGESVERRDTDLLGRDGGREAEVGVEESLKGELGRGRGGVGDGEGD